jgi:hypothetical protein
LSSQSAKTREYSKKKKKTTTDENNPFFMIAYILLPFNDGKQEIALLSIDFFIGPRQTKFAFSRSGFENVG